MTAPAVVAAPPAEEITEHVIGPNNAQQRQFLSSSAHVLVGGGAAGGGKTFVQLLDPMRFMYGIDEQGDYFAPVPGYTAVLFRRTSPELTNEGGPWDTSVALYGQLPFYTAVPGNTEWRLPVYHRQQCTLRMTHLQHAWTVNNFYGAQIPYISYDQLEHFEESQFFTMLSRNRSATGVPGLTRAGCNPDPDSFVYELIKWWIDHREEVFSPAEGRMVKNFNYGYPYPERSGVLRWFVRGDDGNLVWGNTRQEMYQHLPKKLPPGIEKRHLVKSLTFIGFKAEDNPDLMKKDPGYIGSLLLQDAVQRERLLGGNWLVRPQEGKIFPKTKARIIDALPAGLSGYVKGLRYWDKAGSEKKGSDWSVGLKMFLVDGKVIIADVVRGQWQTAERESTIATTASQDGKGLPIVIEQEPASGGKDSVFMTVTQTVPGYDARPDVPSGDLELRSRPLAAQWQVGNVYLVRGEWNEKFLKEMNSFDGKPSTATKKDDQVSAASGGYNYLMRNDVGPLSADQWATVRG